MSKVFKYIIAIFLTISSLYAQDAAKRKSVQMGEIVLEKDAAKKSYTFVDQQDDTLNYMKLLNTQIDNLSQGNISKINPPSKEQLEYLDALYLYCTINLGTCPDIIDTVLEIDITNSRISKESTCPNMKQFWKIWINSDMEKRQSYSIKTGVLNIAEEFKRKDRPQYIQCESKVKSEIEGSTSDSEYFKARYSEQSGKRKAVAKTYKLIEDLKAKKINIFSSTGVR